MFYSDPKNKALFHNSALALAAIFMKSMNPLGSIAPFVPSFKNPFEDTPMYTKETKESTEAPEVPSQNSGFSLFSGLPEKIAQKGMADLFFAVTGPVFTGFGSQANAHTGMGSALTVPSTNIISLAQPSASSSFGFFENAAETPLQQSMMPNAYQLAMICITVAVASMALMSLYNSYSNSDKQKCQSGCKCCECTATATATATAGANGTASVTATATATCGCK